MSAPFLSKPENLITIPPITIKYFVASQYGCSREFVHPDCAHEAALLRRLTGQKTINPELRAILSDLAGIQWERTFDPNT